MYINIEDFIHLYKTKSDIVSNLINNFCNNVKSGASLQIQSLQIDF